MRGRLRLTTSQVFRYGSIAKTQVAPVVPAMASATNGTITTSTTTTTSTPEQQLLEQQQLQKDDDDLTISEILPPLPPSASSKPPQVTKTPLEIYYEPIETRTLSKREKVLYLRHTTSTRAVLPHYISHPDAPVQVQILDIRSGPKPIWRPHPDYHLPPPPPHPPPSPPPHLHHHFHHHLHHHNHHHHHHRRRKKSSTPPPPSRPSPEPSSEDELSAGGNEFPGPPEVALTPREIKERELRLLDEFWSFKPIPRDRELLVRRPGRLVRRIVPPGEDEEHMEKGMVGKEGKDEIVGIGGAEKRALGKAEENKGEGGISEKIGSSEMLERADGEFALFGGWEGDGLGNRGGQETYSSSSQISQLALPLRLSPPLIPLPPPLPQPPPELVSPSISPASPTPSSPTLHLPPAIGSPLTSLSFHPSTNTTAPTPSPSTGSISQKPTPTPLITSSPPRSATCSPRSTTNPSPSPTGFRRAFRDVFRGIGFSSGGGKKTSPQAEGIYPTPPLPPLRGGSRRRRSPVEGMGGMEGMQSRRNGIVVVDELEVLTAVGEIVAFPPPLPPPTPVPPPPQLPLSLLIDGQGGDGGGGGGGGVGGSRGGADSLQLPLSGFKQSSTTTTSRSPSPLPPSPPSRPPSRSSQLSRPPSRSSLSSRPPSRSSPPSRPPSRSSPPTQPSFSPSSSLPVPPVQPQLKSRLSMSTLGTFVSKIF